MFFPHLLLDAGLLLLDGGGEAFVEEGNLGNEVGEAVLEGLGRRVVVGGLDPQHELVLQRVGDLVAGEQHLRVSQQLPDILLLLDQVSEI